MPIFKNATLELSDENRVYSVVVVQFGGDISVTNSRVFENKVHLALKELDEFYKIGSISGGICKISDFKPDVILEFSKVESIDVVIKYLKQAKKELKKLK